TRRTGSAGRRRRSPGAGSCRCPSSCRHAVAAVGSTGRLAAAAVAAPAQGTHHSGSSSVSPVVLCGTRADTTRRVDLARRARTLTDVAAPTYTGASWFHRVLPDALAKNTPKGAPATDAVAETPFEPRTVPL